MSTPPNKKLCTTMVKQEYSPEQQLHLLPVFEIQYALQIPNLNDDCLRLIFRCIPLPKLISLRLICSKWKFLVESMCKTRHSLKLFANYAGVESYCNRLKINGMQKDAHFRLKHIIEGDDDLVLNITKYNLDFYYFLPSLFPNVRHLSVNYDCAYKQFRQLDLPMLLEEWSRLISLTIINFPCNDRLLDEIWQCVKLKLMNLKQLHLFDAKNFDLIPSDVLSRLEQASIVSFVGNSEIYPHLGKQFTHLRIGDTYCSATSLDNSLKLNPDLANSLTHLTVASYLYDLGKRNLKSAKENMSEVFLFICSNFPKIVYLDTISPELPFTQILRELARLSRLTNLKLYISSSALTLEKKEEAEQEEEIENELENVAHLESIELLHLKVHSKHVNDQYGKWLATVFPSVRELLVKCDNPRNLVSVRMYLTNFEHLDKSLLYTDDEEVIERARYMGRHCRRYMAKNKCECIIVPA